MIFTIKLSPEQVNLVLTGLNELKHGAVRETFDHVIGQVKQQEAAPDAAPAESAGLSD